MEKERLENLKQKRELLNDELMQISLQMAALGRKLHDLLEEKRLVELKIKKSPQEM